MRYCSMHPQASTFLTLRLGDHDVITLIDVNHCPGSVMVVPVIPVLHVRLYSYVGSW